MPATSVVSPLIGPSLTQVWKPTGTVGSASDGQAPFALGMPVQAMVANVPKTAVFCRVAAAGIAIDGTAGITDGVTVAAAAGNTYTNKTGVALIVGDYAFLVASQVLTP